MRWVRGAGVGSPVLIYDITSGSWAIHSWPPTCSPALTTYHSQLVLIGGLEIDTGIDTNKVWMWQEGEWHPSLPPMTVARRSASAVSSASHIIVAGGLVTSPNSLTVSGTDSVEYFDGHSWMMAQSLPMACWNMKSTLHNGMWYFGGGGNEGREVFSATVQAILDSTELPAQSQVWSKLPQMPDRTCSIASIGQQLVAIGGRPVNPTISAYIPHTQSWVHVEDIPPSLSVLPSCALTLPNGDLMVVMNDEAWIGQLEGIECADFPPPPLPLVLSHSL